ncbi:GNAT family N-acetyltransferase [Aeromicrobium endophyticum]|uniref:GNAT family N-acetyltransferase n=1 Tax=Aeromicrobium endophyticum TaxID=2292704 RepID=A0A371PA10_9ACTN|nr:GNAT family N-acetyltransferase [Aeromicrobium endophyticum]REK72742.1 GNAT family N-acetyltransferase [Aeromicrobium endophyticum]
MNLTLNFVDGTPLGHEWVEKPFVDTEAFDRTWWVGQCAGPVAFASFVRDGDGEVARAQIKLRSRTGSAYPTWDRREGGVTEIDLIAVKDSLRGGGIGGQALALLVAEYGAPIIALAKNEKAEGFWRKQHGWEEHLQEADEGAHPEAPKAMPLYVWNG